MCPSHEGGFEMRRRASRRDEEVELSENLISGRLNGDRRGGNEPDFTEIGIVLRNRSGHVMKVLRPYKGDFREVFDGEAARIILLDFERVLARETEEPLPCALPLLTGHRRSAAFASGIVPASPSQDTTPCIVIASTSAQPRSN
jgi:hypothetical protein